VQKHWTMVSWNSTRYNECLPGRSYEQMMLVRLTPVMKDFRIGYYCVIMS
jgi:hypothetical protein